MQEVTHEEFFRTIGKYDCHPEIVGKYPYTSIFRMRNSGKEVGRKVDGGDCSHGDKYLLPDTSLPSAAE